MPNLRPQLLALSQSGFAVIPLLILMLFGIAAGVLLVQNGVNFIPKAQEEWNPGNDNVFRIRYEEYCYANASGERVRKYHIKEGNNLVESKEAACDNASRPCGDFMKQFCGIKGLQCSRSDDFHALCITNTFRANVYSDARSQVFPCTLEQAKTNSLSKCPSEQKLRIDHCDLKSDPNVKIVAHESCLNTETPDNYNYFCHWSALCSGTQQSPINPATAPATTPTQARTSSTANPPATATNPRPGSPSQAAPAQNPVRPAMTSADCGYTDQDGLSIPCYKVGVFNSADELQATQDLARLATSRYLQSQEILTAVKGKINDQVFAKAQEKLNAAKAAADACMKQ